VLDFRVRRSTRIRPGQLRVTQRHAPGQHKEAVPTERDGTLVVDRSILGATRAGRIRQFRHGQYPEIRRFPRMLPAYSKLTPGSRSDNDVHVVALTLLSRLVLLAYTVTPQRRVLVTVEEGSRIVGRSDRWTPRDSRSVLFL